MLDPITYWSRVMTALGVTEHTGRQLVETAVASEKVVTARIGLSAGNPGARAGHEASRMVPEKLTAATAAGQAFTTALWKMQSEWADQGASAIRLMMKGRPPTFVEATEFWSKSAMSSLRLFESAAGMGRDTLKPYHVTVKANARRLRVNGRG